MFCPKCGKEIQDEAVVCIGCGTMINSVVQQHNPEDTPSMGLNILAFLIPIVGLILYIVYSSSAPTRAKGIGKFALIGFILGIVGWIMLTVIGVMGAASYY